MSPSTAQQRQHLIKRPQLPRQDGIRPKPPKGKANHSTPVLCWGHKVLPAQKGITTYMVSSTRLRPLAHAGHNAIFNTARRMRHQFWYVVPPFVAAYFLARWMDGRNQYLNSKAGRGEVQ